MRSVKGAGVHANPAGVKVDIARRFDLKDAADAHRAIESRDTTGAMILVP